VSGKNKTSFGEMIRLDIAYERRRSFLFDLMIMGKTPLVLVTQVSESLNPPSEEHVYESAH
jgi:lipopolysaccharide/colanic/teichoic acid biosynthesis glycosyltransferase